MHLRHAVPLALLSVVASLWTPRVKAESWHKTYQLSGVPTLAITADDADIRVSSWASYQIGVTVDFQGQDSVAARSRIDESQIADTVTISVRKRRHAITLFDRRASQPIVEVHMPAAGRVTLKTGDGDIRVVGVKGEMDLRTGDGSQDISDSAGSLSAIAGDGNVHAKGVFGLVQITAEDGSVDLYAKAGSQLDADWSIRTGDGDVRISLPLSLSASLDALTADGSIHLALPVTVIEQQNERRLKGNLAKGGRALVIRVGDGDIALRKAT